MQNKVSLSLFLLATISLANYCYSSTSAVILQYHHVDKNTPPSTSVTPEQFEEHLSWLKANDFDILPLPEVVHTLKSKKKFSNNKTAAITFDDANISVCESAWPILKKHKIPFTLFISTEAIERKFKSQCSWTTLKTILESNLMTPANHSHRHLNMISHDISSSKARKAWETTMTTEIEQAQKLIQQNLGEASLLFAYPYGEYNSPLSKIVSDLGFTAFGQHSGAAGYLSDFFALPRFSVSTQYADINSLKVKLMSLPYPAKLSSKSDNPIDHNDTDNPPSLTLHLTDKKIIAKTSCFNQLGEKLAINTEETNLTVKAKTKLSKGRHRYTCTSPSDITDRFFWISHQWLVE